MRLLKNILWMSFIALLLAGFLGVFCLHTEERASGSEPGFPRDSIEALDQ
jgi:hypothetical protein